MGAQIVKGFVVLFFFHVGQFMHGDHAQKFQRHVLEDGGDADLVLGFELAALDPRDRGVQAEGVLDHLDLVVESDLVDRGGVAQEFSFQVLDVVVQGLVGADAVGTGIALAQHVAEFVLVD